MVKRRNLVSLCKPCHAARDWLHFDDYRTIRGILSRSGGPRRGPLRPSFEALILHELRGLTCTKGTTGVA
jgi:hypothetical protein